MRVVYIAGPFRGPSHWDIVQNVRKAEKLALRVWATPGFVALCPHLNTAHFQGALPDNTWLGGDLELLERCDCVLLVDGWQHSSGTRAEVAFTEANNIPCFNTLEEMTTHYADSEA